MHFNFKKKSTVLSFYLVVASCAYAQQLPQDSLRHHTLETIEVNGRKLQTLRAGMPTQVIDSKQLSTLNAANLSDVVSHFSGVTIKDYGGIGGQKTVSLRGLGAQFTGVSFDGFVSNNVQSCQVDLGKHSLDNVSEISLSNGQPNDIFLTARSFASGGLLEVKTKMPSDGDSKSTKNNHLRFKTGSFGLINPGAFLMGRMGSKLSYNFDLNAVQAHGRYRFIQKYANVEDAVSQQLTRTNADIKGLRSELNLRYALHPNEELFVKSNFYYSERGLPGSVVYYNPISSYQSLDDRNINVGINYTNKRVNRFEQKYYLNYSNAMNHFVDTDPKYNEGPLSDRYLQQELYFSGVGKYSINPNWTAVASADWWYNTLDLVTNVSFDDFVRPTRHTALLNVATKYVDERWNAGANLLLTQTFEATRTGTAAPNKQKLTPSVNVSYKILADKEMRLRAFYKNIYRLPSFNDLYYVKLGNNNLRPENSHQFNVGFTYLENKFPWLNEVSITSDIYFNKVTDKIIATPKDLFHWSMINKGKVEMMGADLKLSATKSFATHHTVAIALNYSLQHAVDKTPNSATYNEQIPYTPLNSGSAALSYSFKKLDIGYNVQFAGVRYSGQVSNFNTYMAPYSEHSINAGYRFKSWRVNVEWINIFNTQYEVVQFYPMPRMNFRATIQYLF